MRFRIFRDYLLSAICSYIFASCNQKPEQDENEFYSDEDFSRVLKYDTHVHLNSFDTSFIALAKKYQFRLLSINVASPGSPDLEKQQLYARTLTRNFPHQVAYTTSFDITGIEDSSWLRKKLDSLDRAFDNGAIGVKVWKNIGMDYRTSDGKFVMIDDPRIDSIFGFIAAKNKILIAHIGEPRNCWLPLEEMTVKNDSNYFAEHPQYHMFLHPEFPSYHQHIAARDHVLEKHPGLRVDGAHLGSLEWNVDTLAATLDRFPNLAVDMAARIGHLQYQAISNHKKVRDFIIKYQDRLFYATDSGIDETDDIQKVLSGVERRWRNDWKFFTSGEQMETPEVHEKFQGLHLPASVVDKIYRYNAERWFPGF